MKKELTCIACPFGCRLTAMWQDEKEIFITGNRCGRGIEYGKSEIVSPVRVVTATVRINSGKVSRLPVITGSPVKKQDVDKLLNKLYSMVVEAPVRRGDVILKFDEAGTDVVAARTVTE